MIRLEFDINIEWGWGWIPLVPGGSPQERSRETIYREPDTQKKMASYLAKQLDSYHTFV